MKVKDGRVRAGCSCGACEDNNDSDTPIYLRALAERPLPLLARSGCTLFVQYCTLLQYLQLALSSIFRQWQHCEITHSRLILCVMFVGN